MLGFVALSLLESKAVQRTEWMGSCREFRYRCWLDGKRPNAIAPTINKSHKCIDLYLCLQSTSKLSTSVQQSLLKTFMICGCKHVFKSFYRSHKLLKSFKFIWLRSLIYSLQYFYLAEKNASENESTNKSHCKHCFPIPFIFVATSKAQLWLNTNSILMVLMLCVI